MQGTERIETIVVGSGQAGLAVGYNLARAGRRFVILEAHARVGDSWRTRWDSLRAFTPAIISGLDGMPFPGPRWAFPTKDGLADYFEAYAARFELPIRTNVTVTRVSRDGDRFTVETSRGRFEADNVVVASGHEHTPSVPAFARELDPKILQLHSKEYRRPSQLRPGPRSSSARQFGFGDRARHRARARDDAFRPLPARTGRSVAPSADDARAAAHPPVGHDDRHADRPQDQAEARAGRRAGGARPEVGARRGGGRASAANRRRSGRIAHARGRSHARGRERDWCTGFRTDLAAWIDLPIFAEDGEPIERRGIVPSMPACISSAVSSSTGSSRRF